MILRRVIEHVKDQNWTAVALDFVIVVVGVFIGIQVANWNDARREAAAQVAMLDRLQEEFEQMEPVLEDWLRLVEAASLGTQTVITALRHEAPPTDELAFRRALAQSNWVANPPEIASTYSELVSTGRLSDLRDQDIRNALTRYGDAHSRTERVYAGAVPIVFAPGSNYYRAVDWSVEPEHWETDQAILAYDWVALRASRAEMQAWLPFQNDLAVYGGRELAEVRRLLKLLEERQ